MKMYFKGGKGIENPVDFNGNEIKDDAVIAMSLSMMAIEKIQKDGR